MKARFGVSHWSLRCIESSFLAAVLLCVLTCFALSSYIDNVSVIFIVLFYLMVWLSDTYSFFKTYYIYNHLPNFGCVSQHILILAPRIYIVLNPLLEITTTCNMLSGTMVQWIRQYTDLFILKMNAKSLICNFWGARIAVLVILNWTFFFFLLPVYIIHVLIYLECWHYKQKRPK